MNNKKYGFSANQIQRYGFKLCLEVYEKNNRRCDLCGATERLAIHHIDNNGRNKVNNGEEANNDLDNLQLLCIKCHGSIHGKESAQKRWGKNHGTKRGREKEYMREYHRKHKKL